MKEKSKMPFSSLDGNGSKNTQFEAEKKIVYLYLIENTATNFMVNVATGVKRENICRHKAQLQKEGLLWHSERANCLITGRKVWYLTTNINHPNRII